MPQLVDTARWRDFFAALSTGMSRDEAAKTARISNRTIDNLFINPAKSTGFEHYKEYLKSKSAEVIPRHRLSGNPKRCLDDFEEFRYRYFGHVSRPWHVNAANAIRDLHASDRKEYAVINVMPGGGKTTLFSHDIPVWLAVRDRTNRCMIGTGAETTGTDYTMRIKTTLERLDPVVASEMDKRRGLAVDAKACLTWEYGRFKPADIGYWRTDKLTLALEGGRPAHQKEPSFVSYGRKSGFLGGRFNLVVWDDVVNDQNSRNADELVKLSRWWENTAETRLEPGGLLLLQGQRLSGTDLYRYALDLRDVDGYDGEFDDPDFDPEKLAKKYTHIVYKAHDDTKCLGSGPTQKWHDPKTAKPWPDGCMLDPQRVTYRDLRLIEHNNPGTYATVYQQEDRDPDSVLVQPVWFNGGISKDGTSYVGCIDKDRQLGQYPAGLAGDVFNAVTVDPSPSNFWSVAWWAYQVDTKFQHLVDLCRKRMEVSEFLDFDLSTGKYTGLLEDWYQRSVDIGKPITHVIVEVNAAQKFMLQYDHVKKWSSLRGVQFVAHSTQRNKADAELGVHALAPEYKFGRVRVPWHPLTRVGVMPLYREVTTYPHSPTTDCVMSHWFLLWNAPNLFIPGQGNVVSFNRPSWVRNRPRGVSA